MSMDLDSFLALSTQEVSALVKQSGSRVCVFPINGTRRWFALEHADRVNGNPLKAYLDVAGRRHIELYKLVFDHGMDILLTPVFGSELLTRGDDYVQHIAGEGLARLATHPDFLDFYAEYGVRVRFYGDYRRRLSGTPNAHLVELFEELTRQTHNHSRFRLLFGVFANDATSAIGELAIQHHTQTGYVPTREEIIKLYYGEYLPPVDMFIGFDKFAAFDMPLLATGEEDLYFTVSPSPYLDEDQLRRILYDHLFSRRNPEPEYETLSQDDWEAMRRFYRQNHGKTMGVGQLQGGFWYPTGQDCLQGEP